MYQPGGCSPPKGHEGRSRSFRRSRRRCAHLGFPLPSCTFPPLVVHSPPSRHIFLPDPGRETDRVLLLLPPLPRPAPPPNHLHETCAAARLPTTPSVSVNDRRNCWDATEMLRNMHVRQIRIPGLLERDAVSLKKSVVVTPVNGTQGKQGGGRGRSGRMSLHLYTRRVHNSARGSRGCICPGNDPTR